MVEKECGGQLEELSSRRSDGGGHVGLGACGFDRDSPIQLRLQERGLQVRLARCGFVRQLALLETSQRRNAAQILV